MGTEERYFRQRLDAIALASGLQVVEVPIGNGSMQLVLRPQHEHASAPCVRHDCERRVRPGMFFCSPEHAEQHLHFLWQADHRYYCWGCRDWIDGEDSCEHYDDGVTQRYEPI